MHSHLTFTKQLAKEAGKILRRYWGRIADIQQKESFCDLVTEADRASEKLILSAIEKTFPTHAILSEESGLLEKPMTENLWIVDPLDGTTNYTHQYPWVATSIALKQRGEITIGVVYNPIYDELFAAEKGQGATLNGAPLCVSNTRTLDRALLATGFAYDRRNKKNHNYPEFCRLTNLSHGVRRGGSAALDLSYVAAGRLDGFWEKGLKPWDIAAGALLVEEAGGSVSNIDGAPLDLNGEQILASNGQIHKALSEALLN